MITIGNKKGGLGEGRMKGVVVVEFCKGEVAEPVSLMVIRVETEILFERLDSPFGLAVCLGMIRSG